MAPFEPERSFTGCVDTSSQHARCAGRVRPGGRSITARGLADGRAGGRCAGRPRGRGGGLRGGPVFADQFCRRPPAGQGNFCKRTASSREDGGPFRDGEASRRLAFEPFNCNPCRRTFFAQAVSQILAIGPALQMYNPFGHRCVALPLIPSEVSPAQLQLQLIAVSWQADGFCFPRSAA